MKKTIIVSGVSSGIGRATAGMLIEQGYRVIGLARRAGELVDMGAAYKGYTVDFSVVDTLERILKEIIKQEPDIFGAVCCCGYGEFQHLEQFSVENMRKLMDVNFISQAVLLKAIIPGLKKSSEGKVIIIGSECGLEGQKMATMYSASKFALRGFAQSLRKECASANVGITLINSGLVDTPFYQDLNFQPGADILNSIQPEQIAQLIQTLFALDSNCLAEEINLQPMKKVVVKQ
jgi:3-hydroxy acid dehydrogenase/malonic semialdehyde reductase